MGIFDAGDNHRQSGAFKNKDVEQPIITTTLLKIAAEQPRLDSHSLMATAGGASDDICRRVSALTER
jgi:hypothetical protein